MALVNKTLVYKYAYFRSKAKYSLEGYLKNALEGFEEISSDELIIDFKDFKFEIIEFDSEKESCFGRIVGYEPGSRANVIKRLQDDNESEQVDATDAPEDSEFLRIDIIFMCKGNHFLICNGKGRTSPKFYIQELFEKKNLHHDAQDFYLGTVADKNVTQNLRKEVIDDVSFDVSLSQAKELDIEEDSKSNQSIFQAAATFVRGITEKPINYQDDKVNRAFSTRFYVKVNKTISGQEGNDVLLKIGEDALDEFDQGQVQIHTKSGNTYTPDQVKVSKKYEIQRDHETVDYTHTKKMLRKFLKHITDGKYEEIDS